MPRPRKILVVCHGNICRSPFLAALLRRQLIDVNVSSAGFAATGESVPKEALELAARRRIDLSKFRSQLLTRERADEADLVIVMEPHQARRMAQQFGTTMDRLIVTGDLDADPNETRAIRDPWNQPIEVFEDTFVRLERCAAKLVTLLERE